MSFYKNIEKIRSSIWIIYGKTGTNLGIKYYVHVLMTWGGAGDSNPLSPFCCPRYPLPCYFDKILWGAKTKLSSPQTSDSSCIADTGLATGHSDGDYHKIIWTQPLMSHWPVQRMSHLRIWNVMQSLVGDQSEASNRIIDQSEAR